MPDSITCARCGMTSRNPDDIRAVYCGHCHGPAYARTAPLPWDDPGADILGDIRAAVPGFGEAYLDARPGTPADLTPEVLLTDGRWLFEGFSGGEARFRFSPLAGPWVSSWRLDATLGIMTADWTRGDMLHLRLSRDVIERAAARLAGEIPVRRLMRPSCAALLAVLKAMQPSAPGIAQEPDTWHCGTCGRFMQVPPGRELVLCGYHESPERMSPVRLTDEQCRELERQMRVRSQQGDSSAASRPETMRVRSQQGDSSAARTRREHHQNLRRVNQARRRRVLDDAEAMIARLDGEGYGVRAKAEQVDAETVSIPELPMFDHDQGGNAARWFPGDPVL